MNQKKYLFILCPPFCGSTILLKILHSSRHCSTFLGTPMIATLNGIEQECYVHKGEGQFLYEMYGTNGKEYSEKRHDLNYELPISEMNEIWNRYWETDNPETKILCDKSPPFVHYAKQIEDFYGKDNTRFIVMNRNPYSAKWVEYKNDKLSWNRFAKEQKYNLETLKNTIYISYEQLVSQPELVKKQINLFVPELGNIDLDIERIEGLAMDGKRNQKLTTEYVDRILEKDKKNLSLSKNKEILNYFNYKYIE